MICKLKKRCSRTDQSEAEPLKDRKRTLFYIPILSQRKEKRKMLELLKIIMFMLVSFLGGIGFGAVYHERFLDK